MPIFEKWTGLIDTKGVAKKQITVIQALNEIIDNFDGNEMRNRVKELCSGIFRYSDEYCENKLREEEVNDLLELIRNFKEKWKDLILRNQEKIYEIQ